MSADTAAHAKGRKATPEDAIELLRALIRTACVNDGSVESGQEIRGVRVLRDYLGELPPHVEVEVVEPEPGRANLIARLRGTNPDAPSLAFVGHLDVVPADPAGWSRDPFSGDLVAGEVWGRGAVDMLNFTAAMTVAFRMLAESGERLEGDLVLAATADEEAGSRYGMQWLVDHRPELVLTDAALTESGGGIPLGQSHVSHVTVTSGQKGAASRRIRVRGMSGHGSMPYGVVSGAHLAAEAVARLRSHATAPVVPAGGWWPALLEALGFSSDLVSRLSDERTLDAALPETGDIARVLHALTHLTLSPTVLAAGSSINVLPGEGTVDVDIRLLSGQTGVDADRELERALDGMPGSVSIEAGLEAPALETDLSDRLYGVLGTVIDEFYPGAQPVPLLTPGGNDARHYLRRGVPCYGFGMFSRAMDIAMFRARFHGDDERIDVESLRLAAAAYHRIAQEFLTTDAAPGAVATPQREGSA